MSRRILPSLRGDNPVLDGSSERETLWRGNRGVDKDKPSVTAPSESVEIPTNANRPISDPVEFRASHLGKETTPAIARIAGILEGQASRDESLRGYLERAYDDHNPPPVDPTPATASNPSGEKSMGHEDTSNDSTAYTFLDYTGLGLILMPTEEIGRRWIDDLPITRHTLIAAGTAMLAGAVVLAISKAIKRAAKPKGPLFQDFAKLANKAWFWVFVAMAIIFGVPFMVSYVSPPATHVASDSTVLCWDGPCAPTHKKPGAEYFKEIGLGSSPGQPLMLQATSIATSERLRMFVDYSEYRNGWMPRTRAFIGEIKEPVRGKIERLPLIVQATKENAGQNTLWWGDPTQNNAVTTPSYSSNIPAILVRARLSVLGPSGEQHHYFMLVRDAANTGTYVGILPEHDSGDWIESWEKE
jgi:hypothetical protein